MAKVEREPARHHLLIINLVDDLLHDRLDKRKVMIMMPPGSAKSTYTSQLLPAWFCNPEQYPSDSMLACSHSFSLVEEFGRLARDMVKEEANVLGVSLDPGASAAGDWRTMQKGGYFCAGVGGGIAGRRAKLGLIDDYLGSEAEAQSKVTRDSQWHWYWNDFHWRLVPQSWEFIIANRRHEDDLIGRLLNHKTASDWLIIKLPMEAKDDDPIGRRVGERLWPEWFTEKQVEDAKSNPRTWSGLFQQEPTPEDGDFFKKDNILTYESAKSLPDNLRHYVGSDYAFRKQSTNDFTCFVHAGLDSSRRLWIIDWFWRRVNTLEAVEEMLRMAGRVHPLCWWAGKENITGSIAPFLYEKMRESNIYIPIEELSEAKDKEQKAQAIKGRVESRTVYFPSFHPKWAEALHQLLSFPNGLHDDFVDAMAKLGQGLSKMAPGKRNVPTVPSNDELQEMVNEPITMKWIESSHSRRTRNQEILLTDW